MQIPFVYGKIAERSAFINRKADLTRLQNNFQALTHTILISPRRWGKSSLVKKAALAMVKSDKRYRVCFMDLNNARTESDFYKIYAETVINSTSTKLEDAVRSIKSFFKRVIPKISISPEAQSEISLSMDWNEIAKNPSEILQLPERIAKRRKIKIILCLDEFQNIAQFRDPLAFQKTLRAHWQHHRQVVYCLYGSKRHMMMELFSSANMPFYKFGDLIFLQRIETEHWIKYIQNQFSRSGKGINRDLVQVLVGIVDSHAYYAQQLAQLVWLRTDKTCSASTVSAAFEGLQLQLSMPFQQITGTLSTKQIRFLQALLDGAKGLSSQATIKKYRLGTSATVNKVKKALEDKEILDLIGGGISFNDPVYKHWLKNYYFR